MGCQAFQLPEQSPANRGVRGYRVVPQGGTAVGFAGRCDLEALRHRFIKLTSVPMGDAKLLEHGMPIAI